MDSWTTLPGAGTQTTAIDLDGHDLGGRRHVRRQFAAAVLGGLLVPCGGQFGADLRGDPLDVAGADLDTGQVQGEGGVGKGVQAGGRLNNLLQHAGAVAVVVQTQAGPQGGKSPGGSRDSGPPVRAE